jgi:hypothetical protein
MESLNTVHKSVRDTLFEWKYAQGDIVHSTDLAFAFYHCIDTMSCIYQWHVVCMCLAGEITEYGDGLYGINEATTS